MRILAASGRLPQVIEQTREQLKKTPSSIALHERLVDYYTAARQTDAATREIARILELKPDDADLRLRVAVELASRGDFSEALRQYRAVAARNPELAADSFGQIATLLERAGKTAASWN